MSLVQCDNNLAGFVTHLLPGIDNQFGKIDDISLFVGVRTCEHEQIDG